MGRADSFKLWMSCSVRHPIAFSVALKHFTTSLWFKRQRSAISRQQVEAPSQWKPGVPSAYSSKTWLLCWMEDFVGLLDGGLVTAPSSQPDFSLSSISIFKSQQGFLFLSSSAFLLLYLILAIAQRREYALLIKLPQNQAKAKAKKKR